MPAESVIERLKRLESEAAKGPWTIDSKRFNNPEHYDKSGSIIGDDWIVGEVCGDCEGHSANAALIVAMRNALPALLAVAEAGARVACNWDKCDAMQNPSLSDANHGNAIDDLCAAVRALRAGGSDV